MEKKKVLILGAAGRDFHDFNTFFRRNKEYEVIGFTQSMDQNLGEIKEDELRRYPSELSTPYYKEGIPIYPETQMKSIINEKDVDEVVFSYSDVSHEDVMHKASIALANDANFRILGPKGMMLETDKPVVAIDAVRTGIGKSQVSLKITQILKEKGYEVIVVREPMPYGDLKEQEIQRFEKIEDLNDINATIEEREEYERHLENGNIVYSGIDYEKILNEVEEESEIIIWEGGNNELPFFRPDLHIVLLDPLRAGHEKKYHPGEANLRMADYALINKENSAEEKDIQKVLKNVKELNSQAQIIHADSVVTVREPELIKNREVLVVEDGPTLTHGAASYGAGYVAAEKYGAEELIDPKETAVGSIKSALEKYDQVGNILPAIGYSEEQIKELETTIKESRAEVVISATPHKLESLIDVKKPIVRVSYMIEEKNILLNQVLEEFLSDQIGKEE